MKPTLIAIFQIFIISICNTCVWGSEPIVSQQHIENTNSVPNFQAQIKEIEKMVSSSHESIKEQSRDMEDKYGQLNQMQARLNAELKQLQDRANRSENNTNDNLDKIKQLSNNLSEISLNNYRNNKGSLLILLL